MYKARSLVTAVRNSAIAAKEEEGRDEERENGPLLGLFSRIPGIYANAMAMIGYKAGNLPNGSIIVFDVLESNPGENGINGGKRKFIDVMVKDSLQYSSTAGWGFEEFDKEAKAAGILTQAQKEGCLRCHTSKKGNDYIFSAFIE